MPIAIAGALVALLFVVLVAAALLGAQWAMQNTSQGVRNVGNSVAPWAVVGGALSSFAFWVADNLFSWAMSLAAQIDTRAHQAGDALAQFTASIIDNVPTWVHNTTAWTFYQTVGLSNFVNGNIAPRLAQAEANLGYHWQVIKNIIGVRLAQAEANIGYHFQIIQNVILPRLSMTEANIGYHWQVIQGIIAQLGTLGGRVLGLEQEIARETQQVIPRIQADVNARALERDLLALRDRVVANERAIAVLWTLAVLAAAGADVIDEVVRIGRDPCGVCVGLDLSDMEGRVAALEVNSG